MKSVFFLFVLLLVFSTTAQENINYRVPSQEILALADFERAPSVSMDTKKEFMLLSYRNTYKTLDDLNQEEIRLGGLRINPITNISSTMSYINNLKIRKISNKTEVQVSGLPNNPKIANISWSPNEQKIAFTNTTNTGVELWFINVVSAEAKKITEDNLNANLGSPYNWMIDNETLLVKVLPKNRPALIDVKKDLPKEQRKILFKLQDSVGLFDFDKKTIFQKSRLDNYFTQNPVIQKNLDTLFNNISSANSANNSINGKPIFIDLKTEFDSYEYLIWVYAKAKFKTGFYIGNSDTLKYRSYSKNIIDPNMYNIELTDKNKNWTIKYKN